MKVNMMCLTTLPQHKMMDVFDMTDRGKKIFSQFHNISFEITALNGKSFADVIRKAACIGEMVFVYATSNL